MREGEVERCQFRRHALLGSGIGLDIGAGGDQRLGQPRSRAPGCMAGGNVQRRLPVRVPRSDLGARSDEDRDDSRIPLTGDRVEQRCFSAFVARVHLGAGRHESLDEPRLPGKEMERMVERRIPVLVTRPEVQPDRGERLEQFLSQVVTAVVRYTGRLFRCSVGHRNLPRIIGMPSAPGPRSRWGRRFRRCRKRVSIYRVGATVAVAYSNSSSSRSGFRRCGFLHCCAASCCCVLSSVASCGGFESTHETSSTVGTVDVFAPPRGRAADPHRDDPQRAGPSPRAERVGRRDARPRSPADGRSAGRAAPAPGFPEGRRARGAKAYR